MKVLLVTGAYPPDKCGVGDYTFQLANALASREDTEVGVLTSEGLQPPINVAHLTVFRAMKSWKIRDIFSAARVIRDFQPDVVHIQFPTQRYDGKLPKYLPVLARMMQAPVVQTWHEHFDECATLSWQNLLACDVLIYVRPDLPKKLPLWVKKWLAKSHLKFIPNASTIPVISLNDEQKHRIKQELSGGKPIVCYFGFAYPNKGVERLFDIANPGRHHLVLICDLSTEHPYQETILHRMNESPWFGNATVTGFLPAQRVGEILAAADAVVFPFPNGAGEWNTSLKAAEASGVFTIATTQDSGMYGYHKDCNIYFADCEGTEEMRDILPRYLGCRNAQESDDPWKKIALAHSQLYQDIVRAH